MTIISEGGNDPSDKEESDSGDIQLLNYLLSFVII